MFSENLFFYIFIMNLCNMHSKEECPVFCPWMMKKYTMHIPREFICPISHDVMIEPVIDQFGFTYSKSAIYEWVFKNKKRTCPMTGEKYLTTRMTINYFAKSSMACWWDKYLSKLRPIEEESPSIRNQMKDGYKRLRSLTEVMESNVENASLTELTDLLDQSVELVDIMIADGFPSNSEDEIDPTP